MKKPNEIDTYAVAMANLKPFHKDIRWFYRCYAMLSSWHFGSFQVFERCQERQEPYGSEGHSYR